MMADADRDRFVGIGEVARHKHIERSTARRAIARLVEEDRIPGAFRTPGGHYRVPESYLRDDAAD
jgi:hypothetical protein